MQRDVSSYAIAPSVKVKLLNAGFLSAADLCDLRPLQLSKGSQQVTVIDFVITVVGDNTVTGHKPGEMHYT